MTRISDCFKNLEQAGRKALIPYITAGDPHPDKTVALMHTLVEGGADIIELGVPFSDPMADGPVIQAACERALLHHTSLQQVLGMVKEFRNTDTQTPIVLMGYQNPIEVMGVIEFAKGAKESQVDGILTVDMPVEQAQQELAIYNDYKLDSIFLIAPTTSAKRIKNICESSSGFVYYVSLKGVTGAGHLKQSDVHKKVSQIKKVSSLPVGVGFGIKNADDAKTIASFADAVVVGSALIRKIEKNLSNTDEMFNEVKTLIKNMRKAMDDSSIKKEVA